MRYGYVGLTHPCFHFRWGVAWRPHHPSDALSPETYARVIYATCRLRFVARVTETVPS